MMISSIIILAVILNINNMIKTITLIISMIRKIIFLIKYGVNIPKASKE